MWSEAENYDLALSFQEKAGCDEIWEKICQVSLINVRLRQPNSSKCLCSKLTGCSESLSNSR